MILNCSKDFSIPENPTFLRTVFSAFRDRFRYLQGARFYRSELLSLLNKLRSSCRSDNLRVLLYFCENVESAYVILHPATYANANIAHSIFPVLNPSINSGRNNAHNTNVDQSPVCKVNKMG